MSLPPHRRRRTIYGADRIDQWRRQQLHTPDDHTLVEIEKVRAIASDPAQYAIADRIPDREPGTPGRPPMYPNWVHIVHTSLHGAFGSANAASRIMNNPDYWDIIRGHAADHDHTARATPRNATITPTHNRSSTDISSSCKTACAKPAQNWPADWAA